MMNKKTEWLSLIGYAMVGAVLLGIFLWSFHMNPETRRFVLSEGGVVETISWIGHLLCACYIVFKRRLVQLHPFFILFLFFMLRELDFDKKFTTDGIGIFKTKFFLSGAVPLGEKIIGGLVILVLIYAGLAILFRYAKPFFAGLKNGSLVVYGAGFSMFLLLAAKLADGRDRKLKSIGITISKEMNVHAGAIEELLEMGIPLAILITLHAYFRREERDRDAAALAESGAPGNASGGGDRRDRAAATEIR